LNDNFVFIEKNCTQLKLWCWR